MGAAAEFTIDTKKFRASMALLAERVSEAAGDAVRIAKNKALFDAQKTTLFQNRTGRLRKSIQGTGVRVTRDGFAAKIRAGVGVKYARPVHDGSKPHVIMANKAPMLRFKGRNGKWVSVIAVMHPGTSPRPFITNAGELGYSTLEHESKIRTAKAIEDFNRGG